MKNKDGNFFACMTSRFFIFKKKEVEKFFANELKDYVSKETTVGQEFVSYKINLESLKKHYFESEEYNVSEEAKKHYKSEQTKEPKEKSKEEDSQVKIIVWKDEYALIISSVFVNAKEEPTHTDGLYRGEMISVIEEECRNKNLFYIRKAQRFDFKPELDDVWYKINAGTLLDTESCYLSVLFDLMCRKSKDGRFVFNKGNEYILDPIKSAMECYSKKIQSELNTEKVNTDELKNFYRFFLLQIEENSKFDKSRFYRSAIERLDYSSTAFNSSCEFVFSDESAVFSFPNNLYFFCNLKETDFVLSKEDYYLYFLAYWKVLLKKIDFFFIGENYKNKIKNSNKIDKTEMEEISANFSEIKLFRLNMQQKVLSISPDSIANLWYQKTSTNVFVRNLEGLSSQLIENYKIRKEEKKNKILRFISASAILSVICDLLTIFGIGPFEVAKAGRFWDNFWKNVSVVFGSMGIIGAIWLITIFFNDKSKK